MTPFDIEKLEAYLNNAMSEQERAEFEKKLAADEELAAERVIYSLEKEGHELAIEADLREKLASWTAPPHNDAPQNNPPRSFLRTYGRRLGWGLALALLVSALLFWPKSPKPSRLPQAPPPGKEILPSGQPDQPAPQGPIAQQPSPPPSAPAPDEKAAQRLAMAYYDRPDFGPSQLRGQGDQDNTDPLAPGLSAWNARNYKKTAAFCRTIPANSPVYWRAQEMLAHALFNTSLFDEAYTAFDRIQRSDQGELSEQAAWNKVLCLVAQGKSREADSLLQTIIGDSGNPQQKDALRLRNETLKK